MIENRPGAGSAIGTEAASRAEPNGNILLIASPAIVINSQLRKLNYNPLTSFEPICLLVNIPNLIAVNSASPYHTLSDLFDAARAKPGELTLAAVGPATSSHIAIEMLKRAANVGMTFVPYPGATPAASALLGGHVTAFFGAYPNVAVNLRAGKLRALATASRTRVESLHFSRPFGGRASAIRPSGSVCLNRCASHWGLICLVGGSLGHAAPWLRGRTASDWRHADPPHAVGLLRERGHRTAEPRDKIPRPQWVHASFDQLGSDQQRFRDGKAEVLGGLHIDHQLELAGLDNREIGRPFAPENSAGIGAELTQ